MKKIFAATFTGLVISVAGSVGLSARGQQSAAPTPNQQATTTTTRSQESAQEVQRQRALDNVLMKVVQECNQRTDRCKSKTDLTNVMNQVCRSERCTEDMMERPKTQQLGN